MTNQTTVGRAGTPQEPPPRRPVRVALAGFMILLMGLGTVSVVVSAWADDAMYDTDIMVQAFGDLPRDPERAEALGDFMAAEAVAGLAVEERIDEVLPLGLSLLAAPITDGIEQAVAAASAELLQTDVFAEMWDEALPAAHEAFVDAVQGSDDGVLTAEAGIVSVDVTAGILATYAQVSDFLPEIANDGLFARVTGLRSGDIKSAIGELLVAYVPEDLGSFVLIESPALAAVQAADAELGQLVWLSVVAAFAAGLAAVALFPRRRTLIALGATLLVALGVGFMATSGAERAIVDAMAKLPFSSGGFSFETWLNGWQLFLLASTGAAVAFGVSAAIADRHQAGPGHTR